MCRTRLVAANYPMPFFQINAPGSSVLKNRYLRDGCRQGFRWSRQAIKLVDEFPGVDREVAPPKDLPFETWANAFTR